MPEGQSNPGYRQRRPPAAFLILVSGFFVALVSTMALSRAVDERSRLMLYDRAGHAGKIIQLELQRVTDDLASSRGLFSASDSVTRADWENFFASREKTLGKIQASSINFLQRVTADNREAFEKSVQADTSIYSEGYPSFSIRPEGAREEYFVINYVYPTAQTERLMGYDSFNDPVRATAIQEALQDGGLHAVFVPELLEGEPGFVPYFPVFRGDEVVGMTTAAFTVSSIFNSESIGGEDVDAGTVAFDIFDGTSQKPIAHIGVEDTSRFPRAESIELEFGDLRMLLVVHGSADYGLAWWSAHAAAVAGGSIALLSFLTFIAVFSVERSRERVAVIAERLSLESQTKSKELDVANAKLSGKLSEGESQLKDKLTELERSRSAMISLLEDLTESRDQTEEARVFDEAMLASLDTAVVVFSVSGRIQRANGAALKLLGMTGSDIVGKKPSEVYEIVDDQGNVVPFENRPTGKILKAGADAQPIAEFGLNLKRLDGMVVPIDINASPVVLGGTLRAVVVLVRDVTEARRIDRAKSEFVSLASHQLRTPLTAIGWYAELLLAEAQGNLTESEQEYLREIYQANRRMSDLVNSLLNVSRIEMGSLDIKPQPIRLDEFLHDEARVFAKTIAEKQLNMQFEIPSDLAPYSADTKVIRIMVQNLLSNAVRYTGFGGTVRVIVRTDDEHLRLTVEDTGMGIPVSDQPKIFGKLFRAENVRLQDTEGSGLGLYLISQILRQVKGEITFTSFEGKGTSFTITLPLSGMVEHEGSKLVEMSAATNVPV